MLIASKLCDSSPINAECLGNMAGGRCNRESIISTETRTCERLSCRLCSPTATDFAIAYIWECTGGNYDEQFMATVRCLADLSLLSEALSFVQPCVVAAATTHLADGIAGKAMFQFKCSHWLLQCAGFTECDLQPYVIMLNESHVKHLFGIRMSGGAVLTSVSDKHRIQQHDVAICGNHVVSLDTVEHMKELGKEM